MADIRINGLPLATGGTAPVGADNIAIDGATTRKAPLSSIGDVVRPFASQAEAEAGTSNSKTMTPLTTAQAISALGVPVSDIGVTIQPYSATLTALSTGASDARSFLDTAPYVDSRTTLKALDTTKDLVCILRESGREGIFNWVSGDFSAQISADTQEGVYIKANAIASSAGAWVRFLDDSVNVKWFGASPLLADNGPQFQCAFDVAFYASGDKVFIPEGFYTVNSAKFTWDSTRLGVRIEGVGMDETIIAFTGTPTKVKCTRENWVAAYDSGASFDNVDYSASTDAAIAWGFKFGGFYCQMNNMAIYLQWPSNEVVNPPVNWGADYDAGVIYQARYFSAYNLRVTGSWRRAALLGDVTQWNGSTDRCYLAHCEFSGNWGHEIMGPKGNAGADLNANDKRGVGGASDFYANGSGFYSIRRNHPPAGGFVRPPWTSSYPGGGIKHSGQAPNTGGKIQGHTYDDCRFHTLSRFAVLLDYDSRTAFDECHFEGQAGFAQDGVTPLNLSNTSAADIRLEFTANSTRTRGFGGEPSGIWVQDDQPHLLGVGSGAAYIGGGSRWLQAEINVNSVETFSGQSRGTWTPDLKGATSTTKTVTAGYPKGTFTKTGRTVTAYFDARVTAITATGAAQIGDLPFTADPNSDGGNVFIGLYQSITFSAGRTQLMGTVTPGTRNIQLHQGGSNQAFANTDGTQLGATTWVRGVAIYEAEF